MIKDFFVSLLHYFVDITTAILIAAAIFLSISGQQTDSTFLWDILISGFVTALPSALLLCFDAKSAKLSWILWLTHFTLIYIITLFLLEIFGWCSITLKSAILVFFAVVFIYLFTCFVHYIMSKKHTTLMNEKLKKRYADKSTAK